MIYNTLDNIMVLAVSSVCYSMGREQQIACTKEK